MTEPDRLGVMTAYYEKLLAGMESDSRELEEMLTAATDTAVRRGYRIDELERWQNVDLENYKRHLAELQARINRLEDEVQDAYM